MGNLISQGTAKLAVTLLFFSLAASTWAERVTYVLVRATGSPVGAFEHKTISIDPERSSAEEISRRVQDAAAGAGWSVLRGQEIRFVPGSQLVVVSVDAVRRRTGPSVKAFIGTNEVKEVSSKETGGTVPTTTAAAVAADPPSTDPDTAPSTAVAAASRESVQIHSVQEIRDGVTYEIADNGSSIKFTAAKERDLKGSVGVLFVRSDGTTDVGVSTDALRFALFKGDWSIDTLAIFSDEEVPTGGTDGGTTTRRKVSLGQALTYRVVIGPKWDDYESRRSWLRGQIAVSFSVGLRGFDVTNIDSIDDFDSKPFFGVGLQLRF